MQILIDIGGTKMRIGVPKEGGDALGTSRIIHTPETGDEAIRLLVATGREIAGDAEIEGVYAGVRAYDHVGGVMRRHRTLPLWENYPIRGKLEAGFGAPAVIENDAAVVGLGEARYGAGKSYEIVAYLTISTGVGGAKISGGAIDESAIGFEPGAEIIDGTHTLEELISGAAVERKYGMHPRDISDAKVWSELAHYLAIGLNNCIVHWSPDCVIVGGSMMNEIGIHLPAVETELKKILTVYGSVPPLLHASLGDLGGLYGALALSQKR